MCHHPSRFLLKAFAIALLSSAVSAFGQRLPQDVQPEHYTLTLTPDLKSATFSGKESIVVRLRQAGHEITLNSIELELQRVSASINGKDFPATVSLDKVKQQATFHFGQTLPAGEATLRIEFTGLLNNELRGFYLSKTKRRSYAVTQFEATDARRAFPCFDEPAFKATFNVSLTVDAGDTAISNTKIVSDKPTSNGKHTLQFGTTPKMSTYLVAFLVGDFKCVEGSSENTPIRVCAVPGDEQYGKFALSAAEYVLHYYNNYFGIKYPMSKLDMIAIPDFEAGAMENFGAITYRETDLLIDERTASLAAKKRVASVVAHEMAHQWFGDLVTMQWWNNVWLNEGFATWMENKPVEAWKPEWHVSQDVAGDLDTTMNYDSQPTTRTIRANASTPAQINEMFDGIAYGKAGAVLGMLENFLGEETFRRGVHNYLAAHLYSNATAEDFWNAQTKTSGKPIDQVMSSFVVQPGVPLLTFDAPQSGSVKVSESRFFITGPKEINASQKWMIPICFHTQRSKDCQLLNSLAETLKVPHESLFYGNAAGKGYYRSDYPETIHQQIVKGMETSLTPEERIVAAGDEWALMMAGQRGIGDYMSVVEALKSDKNPEVFRTATETPSAAGRAVGKLQIISDDVTSEQDKKQFQAWVVRTFHPLYLQLKNAEHGGSADDRERLASLFRVLGLVGKDPTVIAEAQAFTQRYLKDPSSVDPILATTAPTVAVATGDASLYEQILRLHRTANDPTVSTKALYLLAEFHNPELAKRTLDYAVSGQVRNQDAVFLLSDLLRQSSTRMLTWQYFADHWSKVAAQLTPLNGNRIVTAAGGFCTADDADKVHGFFTTHRVGSADRALRQAVEKITECTKLHDQQGPKLALWLTTHASGAAVQPRAGE
jgi:aminopeptidase N/puromycin-sensitive aminopeptidase